MHIYVYIYSSMKHSKYENNFDILVYYLPVLAP